MSVQQPYQDQPVQVPEQSPAAHAAPQVVVVQAPTSAPVARRQKDVGMAYLFLLLFGFLGAHHFYLGKTGRGILYLFTFGLLTVGAIIDLFTLPSQTRQVNTQLAVGVR